MNTIIGKRSANWRAFSRMGALAGSAVALGLSMLAAPAASADELWNPHLRGIDEGCPSALLPPKGVYFVNNTYFASMRQYDAQANPTSYKLDLMVDVPVLLWNPGFKLLNAKYAVAVAQPFDYTSVYSSSAATMGNGHVGTYNTVILPAILSWDLPRDFYLKASLGALAADASSSPNHRTPVDGAGSGNGFWTLEPGVALTYLKNGWNASADIKYDHNFKDTSTDYQSGDELSVDYTLDKSFGNWTAGVGAYQTNQLQDDKIDGVTKPDSIRMTYGAGPLVGYNFGPLNVMATFNWNIKTENDFGGDFTNIRFTLPL